MITAIARIWERTVMLGYASQRRLFVAATGISRKRLQIGAFLWIYRLTSNKKFFIFVNFLKKMHLLYINSIKVIN